MILRTDPLRVLGWLMTVVSAAVILFLTLRPASAAHSLGGPSLCILCGRFGTANLLRNVLLFLPLGLGLGLALRSPLLAWLLTAVLSGAIEVTQLYVPGRNTLLVDFLANSTGGGLGVALAAAVRIGSRPAPPSAAERRASGRWGQPRPGLPAPLVLAGAITLLVSAGTLFGTALSFQLAPSPPPHHIQWTPRLAHFESYRGSVADARLRDEPLRVGRHPDPGRLEEGLFGGAVLTVDFVTGPPPRRLAPIFGIHTAARQEVFVLGARGDDLVLRLPYRATRFRLDRPELQVEEALAGTGAGVPLRAVSRVHDSGACLALDDAEWCGLRPTMGEGWALLLFPERLPHTLRPFVGVAWLAFLAFVPALVLGSAAGSLGVWVVLGTAAVVSPSITASFARATPGELLALLLGSVFGWAAMALLRRLSSGRPRATPVAGTQQPPEGNPGPTGGLRKASPHASLPSSGM